MTDNQLILNGWKDICEAMGIRSVKTAKKKAKRWKMPIVRIDGKPTIARVTLIEWHANLSRLVNRK
jgi:hypothetical protein